MDATQQNHGGVGVHIDEAGNNGIAGAIHHIRAGELFRSRADMADATVIPNEDVRAPVLVQYVL